MRGWIDVLIRIPLGYPYFDGTNIILPVDAVLYDDDGNGQVPLAIRLAQAQARQRKGIDIR
jgi:hypothetical protein